MRIKKRNKDFSIALGGKIYHVRERQGKYSVRMADTQVVRIFESASDVLNHFLEMKVAMKKSREQLLS